MWAMVALSGAIHAALVVAALLFPRHWLRTPPPPLVSYTVDLVAPDKLGGSNMVQGGKGRVHAAPMTSVEVAKPAKPAPKAEPVAVTKPPPVEETKVEAKPEKAAPAPVPPPALKVEPKLAEAKPAPAKPEAKLKENEIALQAKKLSSPPVAKPQPTAKIDASATADAKKKEAEQRAKAEAKAAADKAATEKAAAQKAAADKAAAEKALAEKAAAEKAAAEKAARESGERDSQIAAAIRRVQQRGERGGGLGDRPAQQPGGPIGVGPGEGIGGVVRGVDYLLYYNQMLNRIKASWAWAGSSEALEAKVHFSITETGEIADVRIAKSSGDRGFDASVERAVRAVSPLPPPPELYRNDFADVELEFSPADLKM